MKRVCAAMVTYYPDLHVAERIMRWLAQVSFFCVIDNGSDEDSLTAVRKLAAQGRVVLIENHANLGIAAALNQAMDFAYFKGFEWLLTLDQDSLPVFGYVRYQFAALHACPYADSVAVVGGRPIEVDLATDKTAPRENRHNRWHPEKNVITSGSLCRCDILVRMGGFRTELFIDLVYTEYRLRLRQQGLHVIVSDQAQFYHRFGETRVHRIGPFRLVRRLYTPTRNYYRTRNGLMLALEWGRREPRWAIRRMIRLFRLLMNVIVLHDRKAENLRMIMRGVIDGLRRRTGPIDGA